MALFDPFRVGCCIVLYCYQYSTPMGSWMQLSNSFMVPNKTELFRLQPTTETNTGPKKNCVKKIKRRDVEMNYTLSAI